MTISCSFRLQKKTVEEVDNLAQFMNISKAKVIDGAVKHYSEIRKKL